MIQAVFSTSICFIPDDSCNTCFVYEVQKTMINYLHELLPQVKKLFYFSDGCGGQYKNYKNFMNLCLHKQDFGLDAEWIFFATCDGIGGSVKHQAAKRSLQRPMNNQILDYQVMLSVGEEEMSKIKFFGISKETMDEVRKSLEERFSRGNTVPGRRSSHHSTSPHHHPKLHTSYRVKTSLMLVLMILIFPQLSNCVISDQWHVWHAFMTLFGGWVW